MNPQNSALTRLIEQHASALRLYARQWCRHPDDALQEALIDLCKLTNFPTDPVAWLYLTVKRRAINQTRAETRRQNHHETSANNRDQWFLAAPENEIVSAETIQSLQQALAQLEGLQREIVTARIWGELTFEQIATLIQKPTSTVHRIYHRALQDLQQSLQQPLL